jgi:hypothetical protein
MHTFYFNTQLGFLTDHNLYFESYSNIYVYYLKLPNGSSYGTAPTLAPFAESENELLFALYPNPAHHQFTVQLMEQPEPAQVQLISLHGQLLAQWEIPANTTRAERTLPEQLAPGIYLVKISTSTGTGFQRLVIE